MLSLIGVTGGHLLSYFAEKDPRPPLSPNHSSTRPSAFDQPSQTALAATREYFAWCYDRPINLRRQGPPTAEGLELSASLRGDNLEFLFPDHHGIIPNLRAAEGSWTSAAPAPPMSSNQGASGPSIRATVDALSPQSDYIIPYEKLYPGFDPKEDLEVNLSSRISVCRWGNCQDVWCRLDKMWSSHIFADYDTLEDVTHKAEILSRESRLPDGKVKCLWEGCERSVLVESLKKHIEDTHLLLYRLRCLHCGTEYRHGSYRRIHGPASMCSKNPRFSQTPTPPRPPQQTEQSTHAEVDLMPLPPLPSPSSISLVPPSAPNPHVPQDAPPTDDTTRALDDTRHAQSSQRCDPSSNASAVNPPTTYLDSLGRYLDKRLEARWSSVYAGHRATRARVTTEPTWRTPASILQHHPQQHKTQRRPAVAPVSSASPSFLAPDMLAARGLSDDTSNLPQAGYTLHAWDREPNLGARISGRGDMYDGRSGRDAPRPTEVLGPQAILARTQLRNFPPQYAASHRPQAPVGKPARPQFINPELLVLPQPGNNSTTSQAGPTSHTQTAQPGLKAKAGEKRSALASGRRSDRRLIGGLSLDHPAGDSKHSAL